MNPDEIKTRIELTHHQISFLVSLLEDEAPYLETAEEILNILISVQFKD